MNIPLHPSVKESADVGAFAIAVTVNAERVGIDIVQMNEWATFVVACTAAMWGFIRLYEWAEGRNFFRKKRAE